MKERILRAEGEGKGKIEHVMGKEKDNGQKDERE